MSKKLISLLSTLVIVMTMAVPTSIAGGSPTGPYIHPDLGDCLALDGWVDRPEVNALRWREKVALNKECVSSYKGLRSVRILTEENCEIYRRYAADVSHYETVPKRVTRANSCFYLFPVVTTPVENGVLHGRISVDTPETRVIPAGTHDAHVTTFTFSAEHEDIEINEFIVDADGMDGIVESFKVVDLATGATVFGPSADPIFRDDFVIEQDETVELGILVDISSSEEFYGESFEVGFQFVQGEGLSSGRRAELDFLGDGTSAEDGNIMLVEYAAVDAALSTDSPSGVILPGNDQLLMKVDLTATAADFEVEDLNFVLFPSVFPHSITKVKLVSEDGLTLGVIDDTAAMKDFLFEDIGLFLEQGTTKTVSLLVDVAPFGSEVAYRMSLQAHNSSARNLDTGEDFEDITIVFGHTRYQD